MSQHSKDEPIICPNCGYPAVRNYCAQCGQATQLHKESFIGLILHFVGHYFHYDSKFWQTLKTLWTKPGALSVAYWEKKRNRYISPISLYIFVSAVFFILMFSTVASHQSLLKEQREVLSNPIIKNIDIDTATKVTVTKTAKGTTTVKEIKVAKLLLDPELSAKFLETFARAFPKILFFLIPLMALTLKVLYARRKDDYFVDHAIFSLHIHTFAFTVLLFGLYEVPNANRNWLESIVSFLQGLLPLAIMLYMVIAIHNAYKTGWLRSVLNSLMIFVSYAIVVLAILLGYTVYAALQSAEL